MIQLEPKDFEMVKEYPFGYRWDNGEIEIWLETCMRGFCVGIYDMDRNLLRPKECTNFETEFLNNLPVGEKNFDVRDVALKICNDFLKAHYNNNYEKNKKGLLETSNSAPQGQE